MAYDQSSAYFNTPTFDGFLDILEPRPIPKQPDDIVYTIKSMHALRPDILAFDLYGDPKLWWVFASRNPNSIEDPIFDFQAGRTIFLPKLSTLKEVLGI
jgi:hypothetical protein